MNRTLRSANARNIRRIRLEDSWSTPEWLYAELDREFRFEVDVAADEHNHLAPAYYDSQVDALQKQWAPARCWMNPPYSDIGPWTKKAVEETHQGATVVGLLPVRADLAWFHRDVLDAGAEIRFVQGRLRFGGATRTAPFASMVVVWHPESPEPTGIGFGYVGASADNLGDEA